MRAKTGRTRANWTARQGLAIPAGKGTPIPRKRKPFFAFDADPLDLPSSLTGHTVKEVNFVRQKRDVWCWAACAQMALQRFDSTVTQESLASKLFGPDCSAVPLPSACDSPCNLDDFPAIYSPFRNPDLHVNPISSGNLQDEINADQPVQVGFTSSDFTGHVALVIAWSSEASGILFTYLDPKLGEVHGSLQDVRTGNPFGSWQYTWTGL